MADPAPLSFKTRGGEGGWGGSHTRTGPGRPPGTACSPINMSFLKTLLSAVPGQRRMDDDRDWSRRFCERTANCERESTGFRQCIYTSALHHSVTPPKESDDEKFVLQTCVCSGTGWGGGVKTGCIALKLPPPHLCLGHCSCAAPSRQNKPRPSSADALPWPRYLGQQLQVRWATVVTSAE